MSVRPSSAALPDVRSAPSPRSRHSRVAASGAAALAGAPSRRPRHDQIVTDYGFHGTAYGTRVTSDVAGLRVRLAARSPTSPAPAGSTGRDAETLAGVSRLPSDDPSIEVDGHRAAPTAPTATAADGIDAGDHERQPDRQASGSAAPTPRGWSSTGLTHPVHRVGHAASGRLRAVNEVTAGGISWSTSPRTPLGAAAPLGDLARRGRRGHRRGARHADRERRADRDPRPRDRSASASTGGRPRRRSPRPARSSSGSSSTAPTRPPDGGDDSLVGIGRSRARINRDLPAGVMNGESAGAPTPQLLDGVVARRSARRAAAALPRDRRRGPPRPRPPGSTSSAPAS